MEPSTPSPAGRPQGPEAGPSLPTPETPGAILPEQQPDTQVEQAPSTPELERPTGDAANQNAGAIGTADPQTVQQSTDGTGKGDPGNSAAATDLDTPDLANDVDVIEKEWVDKAKEIVGTTSDDPFKQNHNVSLLKADYMKKRYGKDIKIPDDTPSKKA